MSYCNQFIVILTDTYYLLALAILNNLDFFLGKYNEPIEPFVYYLLQYKLGSMSVEMRGFTINKINTMRTSDLILSGSVCLDLTLEKKYYEQMILTKI